ncbi:MULTISPECIES: PepSY domain-containing protein [unclassified Streptomyces]|uniref:PepSY domain-containing protein n=1 Tax=unclassified Streptomyces TaxID=2593676 RepID=UPI0037F5FD46
MKRNFVIAAITAAALIGGGTYTAAVALSSDHGQDGTDAAPVVPVVTATPTASDGASDDNGGDRDDRDGKDDDAGDDTTVAPAPPRTTDPTPSTPSAPRGNLSAAQAVAAALAAHPGAVSSIERDDDSAADRWEIDLLGKDNRWVELRVDAASGTVRVVPDDDGTDDDADDRAALRAATVDVRRAMSAALASVPGTVTSAELDDDRGGPWEVEVRGKDGRTHELNVHAKTATVTVDRDDDSDDGDDD